MCDGGALDPDLGGEAGDVDRIISRLRGDQQRIHQQTLQRILRKSWQG